MSDRRADARHLVGRHSHANAGSADQNTALACPVNDLLAEALGNVRVEHGIIGVTAHVDDLTTLAFEITLDLILQFEASLIAANGNLHVLLPIFFWQKNGGRPTTHTSPTMMRMTRVN